MENEHQDRPSWNGAVAVAPGIGIFRGQAGDTKMHRHWAHQITFSLTGVFSIEDEGGVHTGEAALIRSDTPHRLLESKVISIYVDPASDVFVNFFIGNTPSTRITFFERNFLLNTTTLLDEGLDLTSWLNNVRASVVGQSAEKSTRLKYVLSAMQLAGAANECSDRVALAKVALLSPTRFSHWFKEQTLVPFRSYKKWLKLLKAIELILDGHSMATAAYDAGFADQAHLSRSFSQAFGVPLSDAVKAITHRQTSI